MGEFKLSLFLIKIYIMYTLIICLILLITVIILILWVFDLHDGAEKFTICLITIVGFVFFFVIMSAICSSSTKYVSTYQLEKIENTYVLETDHVYIVKIKNRSYEIKKGDVEIIFANENKLVRIDEISRPYKISWGFAFSYTSYKLYIKL